MNKKLIPVRTHRDAEGYFETSKDKAEYMLVPLEMWNKIVDGDYEMGKLCSCDKTAENKEFSDMIEEETEQNIKHIQTMISEDDKK